MAIGRWLDKEDVRTHTQRNTTQPEQEWNFAICNNKDKSGGYLC